MRHKSTLLFKFLVVLGCTAVAGASPVSSGTIKAGLYETHTVAVLLLHHTVESVPILLAQVTDVTGNGRPALLGAEMSSFELLPDNVVVMRFANGDPIGGTYVLSGNTILIDLGDSRGAGPILDRFVMLNITHNSRDYFLTYCIQVKYYSPHRPNRPTQLLFVQTINNNALPEF